MATASTDEVSEEVDLSHLTFVEDTDEVSEEVDLSHLTFKEDLGRASTGLWDPDFSSDWDKEKPNIQFLMRLKRDILTINKEPPPGMCIVPDENDITKLHALITGPFGTPYEGGFFYFMIGCPPDYPIQPPRVKLKTTGGGTVRFNPNLYRNGKVCLSIIGTWPGPAWSPALSLSSVLISIQSLLNEKPYYNEPGVYVEGSGGDSSRYNDIIRHETLRVGVCDMLEQKCSCPGGLREVMEKSFPDYYDYYVGICEANKHRQGQIMQDPFGDRRGVYDYKTILKRLESIKQTLSDNKKSSSKTQSSDSDLESQSCNINHLRIAPEDWPPEDQSPSCFHLPSNWDIKDTTVGSLSQRIN